MTTKHAAVCALLLSPVSLAGLGFSRAVAPLLVFLLTLYKRVVWLGVSPLMGFFCPVVSQMRQDGEMENLLVVIFCVSVEDERLL